MAREILVEEERRSFGFCAILGFGSSWFKLEERKRGKFVSKEENKVWKLLKLLPCLCLS